MGKSVDMTKSCHWKISAIDDETGTIYFTCKVHDHNKVGMDPAKALTPQEK